MNCLKLNICRTFVLLIFLCAVQLNIDAASKGTKDDRRERIQLAGRWHSTLGNCRLPGIPQKLTGQEDGKWVIYHRTVSIPSSFAGKRLRLVMERTPESTLWVDGDSIGHFCHPCLPHIYELPPLAGKEAEIALKTSGGIYGDFYVEASDSTYISEMAVLPDAAAKSVDVKLSIDAAGDSRAYIRIVAENLGMEQDGPAAQYELMLRKGRNDVCYRLSLGDSVSLWSEFHPDLYRVEARLSSGGCDDIMSRVFGINTMSFDDSGLYVNGKKVFLRGKDYQELQQNKEVRSDDRWKMKLWWWRELFAEEKKNGVNFWEMGDYCPPEAAFAAADIEGVYISASETSIGGSHPSFLAAAREYQDFISMDEDGSPESRSAALFPVVSFAKQLMNADDTLNVDVSISNYTEEDWSGQVTWTLVADELRPVSKETLPSFKGRIDCAVVQGGTARAGRVFLPLSLLGLKQGETCRLTLTLTVGDAEYPYVFRVGDQPVFN